MIIRELVTAFGIDFDDTGAKEADNAARSLQNTLRGIGLGLSFAGVYSMFSSWLGAASSVEEEMNVLTQTFGDSTQGVLEWAKVNSEAMGRSEFDLRKYAGQLGAVLAPMLGTKEAAADMSEQLAGLAVDLGSFFNKDDEETMGRLRSGILGSTEAVDQLGINLRAEHVQAVMAAEGITKHWKSLSEAEKVQYRFMTIMKDTKDKQGDAIRTSDSYANSVKAGEANVQKIAVALGERLMPAAKGVVNVFADMSTGMLGLVNDSGLLEVGLVALAAVATVLVGGFMIANIGILLFAAGAVAALLVVEDLYTSLEKGEGYTADFFTALIGEDNWKKVLDTWEFATTKLGDLIWEVMHPEEMQKRYGNAWASNKNTAMGQLGHGFFGVDYKEQDVKGPGLAEPMSTPVAGKSSIAMDAYTAQWKPPADQERVVPKRYYGALQYDDQRSRAPDNRLDVPMGQNGSEAAFSGLFGPMQSLAHSVDGLAGVVQSIPELINPGVPMSIPAGETPISRDAVYQGGDISIMFQGEQTPDTVREARRVAQELIEDQNRSYANSASSRES